MPLLHFISRSKDTSHKNHKMQLPTLSFPVVLQNCISFYIISRYHCFYKNLELHSTFKLQISFMERYFHQNFSLLLGSPYFLHTPKLPKSVKHDESACRCSLLKNLWRNSFFSCTANFLAYIFDKNKLVYNAGTYFSKHLKFSNTFLIYISRVTALVLLFSTQSDR